MGVMSTERRKPRAICLSLAPADRPVLEYKGQSYPLRNVSENGVGVWVPFTRFNKNEGHLRIGNESYAVKWKVVHLQNGVLGLEFTQAPKALEDHLSKILEVSCLAASLKFVPPIQEDFSTADHKMLDQGEGSSKLIVWFNPFQKMISAIQIEWQGNWVSRKLHSPGQTGKVRKVNSSEVELILHEKIEPHLWQQAAQFLSSLPHPLPEAVLWQFLETGEQLYLEEEVIAQVEVGNK